VTGPTLSAAELLELFAVLGRDVAFHEDTHGAMQAITNVAVQAVRGAHLASITRVSGQHYATAAPTDPSAVAADALQYKVGSGPCLDALIQDSLIFTGDVATDPRWPDWGPEASATAGVNSVLAVRLVLDEDEMLAALNVYSRDRDAFGAESLTMVMLLATHGSMAVSRVIAREKSTNLAKAVTTNRQIGMAMGVLMTTYKVTEEQAFDLLRIASQDSHRKIHDIARDVIDTGALELPEAAQRSPGRNSVR
jgi:GAF domain-containing protein